MRWRLWGAPGGAPFLFVASVLAAQGPPARYSAAMLDGAAFDERVRTTIRTQTGGATRLESVGREARWQVRAAGLDTAFTFEAWYDSLHIWRDSPEGRLLPDTDGLIGGRFRGWVTPGGLVTLSARPFIPDELAEVSDLGTAFTTFLPAVPDSSLDVGGIRDDGRGGRILRRSDSTGADGPLARYRWTRTTTDTLREVEADSLGYEIRSTVQEDGHLVWHPRLGPLAWHRDVVTEVDIPADGAVRRPVRSRVEERLQGWRRSEKGEGSREKSSGEDAVGEPVAVAGSSFSLLASPFSLLQERCLLHTFAHTTSWRPADVGRIPRLR
jgi:hypothetical protein